MRMALDGVGPKVQMVPPQLGLVADGVGPLSAQKSDTGCGPAPVDRRRQALIVHGNSVVGAAVAYAMDLVYTAWEAKKGRRNMPECAKWCETRFYMFRNPVSISYCSVSTVFLL